MEQHLERVVDLTDPHTNQIFNLPLKAARERVRAGNPEAVRAIQGSFALVVRDGKTVRMARSLDHPLSHAEARARSSPRALRPGGFPGRTL